jgi:preprotein translocase subunit SecF
MKTIRFSKAFLPCTIISGLLILSGFVAMFTRGVNFGLDFKPGLMTEVRIAPTALSLGYTGAARAMVETTSTGLSIIVSGAGAENTTVTFPFAEYPTAQHLADGVKTVPNVTSEVASGAGGTPSPALFVDSSVTTVLTSTLPYRFFYGDGTTVASADAVRSALASFDGAEVQQVGSDTENRFQIRVGVQSTPPPAPPPSADSADAATEPPGDGDTPDVSATEGTPVANIASEEAVTESLANQVVSTLEKTFGNDKVAIIGRDYVGAQFSRTLAFRSIWVVLASLGLVLLYSMFRFKWDFGLGAVLAIVHDALIMFAFIAWFQVEFSTTILAAILTVIGYSINDTIVVLDRVRENQGTLSPSTPISSILDTAQTEILSRTIITTATTLLAVVALYVFTSGSMKDFALCLIVGMVSGVYSTIYITGAFIAFVRRPR